MSETPMVGTGPWPMRDRTDAKLAALTEENARLKAEVERLRAAMVKLEATWRDQASNPLWTSQGRNICSLVADELRAALDAERGLTPPSAPAPSPL